MAPPGHDAPYATDIDGLPRTLVVSITGDPASPHQGGIALAETPKAGLLTMQDERHGAVLVAGDPCVDDAVAAYLVSTEAPADARCTL